MSSNLTLIAPVYRTTPDAAEFADVLADALGDNAAMFLDGSTPECLWNIPIPQRDQWAAEAAALAKHVESL